MDVTLHIGAHRTATTSFQGYLRNNAAELAAKGIRIWEPRQTRGGLLTGIIPVAGRGSAQAQLDAAQARIAEAMEDARSDGARHVVISDENMMGAPRRNLRDASLYADIGPRLSRCAEAFGRWLTRVVLSIRPLDSFWRSTLCFCRGARAQGADRAAGGASGLWRARLAGGHHRSGRGGSRCRACGDAA